MDCAECGAICLSGKCHTTGVGVGRHKRMYWVCPKCAETALDFSAATELKPHWLDAIKEPVLIERWGDGMEAKVAAVAKGLRK